MSSREIFQKSAQSLLPRFVFVIHGGPLEAKGALLAASLRKNCLNSRICARLVEPRDRWGDLLAETRALLERLEIEIKPTTNEVDPDYPIGNKIGALTDLHGPSIFLDSDILVAAPFSWHHQLTDAAAAKAADLDTFERGGGKWETVYDIFHMPTPRRTLKSTYGGEPMRPYYNAGFIAVRDGNSFAEMWTETSKIIDANNAVANKRPWLDQIALPVTFERLGWSVTELDERFNYPFHLPRNNVAYPYFAHYHWPEVVLREKLLKFHFDQITLANPELPGILSSYSEWKDVVTRGPTDLRSPVTIPNSKNLE